MPDYCSIIMLIMSSDIIHIFSIRKALPEMILTLVLSIMAYDHYALCIMNYAL